jgi:histone deacetylase complex regulatory component SIN3
MLEYVISITNTHTHTYIYIHTYRFEVDMVIDSNMCTIRILEPLAEEIGNLKTIEGQAR